MVMLLIRGTNSPLWPRLVLVPVFRGLSETGALCGRFADDLGKCLWIIGLGVGGLTSGWMRTVRRPAVTDLSSHTMPWSPGCLVWPQQPLPEAAPEPARIARLDVRRRDRLGSILHEYRHAA